MSFKIHHGPPGSYKTSGAVQDDFIPAAREGRVIVTNVRGLSDRDHVEDVLGELPRSFDIVWVDTSTPQGRHKMATWFHWAEPGSFILMDEGQLLYPSSAQAVDLARLSYPNGPQAAAAAGRFYTVGEAFDMHRHKNYDIVMTCPYIRKVHPDIKGIAEACYKHRNMAVLGKFFAGRYQEAQHNPDDSGSSPSHFINVRVKTITKETFKLYESTATGTVSDTKAGGNVFANGRVYALVALLAFSLYWVLSSPLPAVFADNPMLGTAAVGDTPLATTTVASPAPWPDHRNDRKDYIPVSNLSGDSLADGAGRGSLPGGLNHPFERFEMSVVGDLNFAGRGIVEIYEFRRENKDNEVERFQLTGQDLRQSGYTITKMSKCLHFLKYAQFDLMVVCRPPTKPRQVVPYQGIAGEQKYESASEIERDRKLQEFINAKADQQIQENVENN